MTHIGLYLSSTSKREEIIERIFENQFLKEFIQLQGLHGALFSTLTINKLIDEELRHDRFIVTSENNKSLVSMSSGQQRKALINYIISQNPGFIILDDMLGSIDAETKQYITDKIQQISTSAIIIQLIYRRSDVLPMIQTIYSINSDNQIIKQESFEQFSGNREPLHLISSIHLPQLFYLHKETVNPLVQLNSVSASYGDKPVIKNVSWTIQSGEFWQLKGPIGSGKSTLLSMIIGDNPKGYGQDMVLFGRKKGSGETIWEIKKQIGYFTPGMMLQFKHKDSVENMIISGLVDSVGLYTIPTDFQRHTADAWLQVIGPSFRNASFQSLSFGQQRMVMVVRAMVKQPPLLILDEPTVGLDDENAQLFISLINAIASQKKVAIIYVSHRNEPELQPDYIFELMPGADGSVGRIIKS
jgi:molybdate transport system ATP-binding protein